MSALVAWSVPETAQPGVWFPYPGRAPGVDVAGRAPETSMRRLPGAGPAVSVGAPRLRLTARGRLVRSLVLFGVLALIALVKWLPATETDQLRVDHHAVVRPGQSLTQIAREHLPELPVREAVARLQLTNNLSAPEVSSGQKLGIPAGP